MARPGFPWLKSAPITRAGKSPLHRGVKKFASGGMVDGGDDEATKRYTDWTKDDQAQDSQYGSPVVVRTKGKVDPEATGRLKSGNWMEGMRQRLNSPNSLKARKRTQGD